MLPTTATFMVRKIEAAATEFSFFCFRHEHRRWLPRTRPIIATAAGADDKTWLFPPRRRHCGAFKWGNGRPSDCSAPEGVAMSAYAGLASFLWSAARRTSQLPAGSIFRWWRQGADDGMTSAWGATTLLRLLRWSVGAHCRLLYRSL